MAQVGLLEDNTRIAKLCATMLHYAGHRVVIYEHPRLCLEALLPEAVNGEDPSTMGETPPIDVLILDLHLPDISGMEVLHRLRAHPGTCAIPLIFCSAAPSSEVARALHVAPGASFIEKPFSFQDLILAISVALGTHLK